MSYRRTNEPGGLEVEGSTAGATSPGDHGRWWIATGRLDTGGEKILGPFESSELARQVRAYIEQIREPSTYWVVKET